MPLPRLRASRLRPPPSARGPSLRGSARSLAATALALALAGPTAAQEEDADGWGPRPRSFSVDEVIEIIRSGEGPVLIDARSHGEYLEGHIPTALNVPHKETWGRVEELRRFADRGIVFYCVKGIRSRIAAEGLIGEGFPKVGMMRGHLEEWERRELPLVR